METTQNLGVVGRRTGLVVGLAAAAGSLLGPPAQAAAKNAAVKVTALYNAPKDPAAFEKYYAETHMPLVYAVKGIARVELAKPLPGADGKAPPYYRITELWFDNMQAMQSVTGLPEWKKVREDVPNFATGGATVLVSEIET